MEEKICKRCNFNKIRRISFSNHIYFAEKMDSEASILYNRKEKTFYLELQDFNDGGNYQIEITYCPWCGKRLFFTP